ncbi:MAG: hypothetical protein SFZ23_09525 [Planctomycetota bacterium]|nr:hypothetical protein [Planctomycetota bacterium]
MPHTRERSELTRDDRSEMSARFDAPNGAYDEAPDPDAPPPLTRVLKRVALSATAVGLVLSLLVHFSGGLIAGIWRVGGSGARAGGPSAVDVAVLTEAEFAAMQAQNSFSETPSVPESASELDASALMEGPPGEDGARPLSELGEIGTGVGGGEILGAIGVGVGGSGAGGAGASFFGVEAQGNRFGYVFDLSGSMGVGNKIDRLREELMTSVLALDPAAEFFLVGYADDAQPLSTRREWLKAGDREKRWARENIARLRAEGGTKPEGAFDLLFAMRPKPHAIYFMTDGEFEAPAGEMIALRGAQLRIPVHCICLETRGSEEMMKRIAERTGGSYTFIGASETIR